MYEKLCESLREHAKNVIYFEKKKMFPLTKEELKSHQDATIWYIWGKRILKNLSKSKNCRKVRDHCHYADKYGGAAYSAYYLKFNVANKMKFFIKFQIMIIILL